MIISLKAAETTKGMIKGCRFVNLMRCILKEKLCRIHTMHILSIKKENWNALSACQHLPADDERLRSA
jgi:hypothetical protein